MCHDLLHHYRRLLLGQEHQDVPSFPPGRFHLVDHHYTVRHCQLRNPGVIDAGLDSGQFSPRRDVRWPQVYGSLPFPDPVSIRPALRLRIHLSGDPAGAYVRIHPPSGEQEAAHRRFPDGYVRCTDLCLPDGCRLLHFWIHGFHEPAFER